MADVLVLKPSSEPKVSCRFDTFGNDKGVTPCRFDTFVTPCRFDTFVNDKGVTPLTLMKA